MKLEYCRSDSYNFGDDLNPWLWPKLFGDLISEDSDVVFVGIGTVLTNKRINVQLKDAREIIIFSSGAWGHDYPELDSRCKVYGVRGPRTANKFNLSHDLIVGDGAYLLRTVDIPKPSVEPSGVGFIPHHRSEDYIDWTSICESIGIKFISAKQPVDDFLIAIQSCDKIVTEAMHGAIVADAFRIPWVGTSFSPSFNTEKWFDFAEALEIDLKLHDLPFMSQYKMKKGKLLENTWKKALSRLVKSTPDKWDGLVSIYSTAKKLDILNLENKLKILAFETPTQLSSEEKLNAVTNKQLDVVKQIILDRKK
jgi:succinoglycan biosynthesis protein ExoV